MDKFTKGILTVIAVGVIGINIQMLNGGSGFIGKAHAITKAEVKEKLTKIHKVAICDEYGMECVGVSGHRLYISD